MNIWIIIWRFNPIHIWHEALINESLSNNDKTIIVLWSTNKIDKNNPLNFEQRKNLITLIYEQQIDKWIIEIKSIADYETDFEWFLEIKKLLNPYLNDKLTFYWWDVKNDYAINVIKEFENNFNQKVYFIEKPRSKIKISATQIREMISKQDYKNLKYFVNEKAFDFLVKNHNLFE